MITCIADYFKNNSVNCEYKGMNVSAIQLITRVYKAVNVEK